MLTVFIRYLAKRFTYVLLLEWPNQWEFSKFKFNLCCSFFMSSSHSMVLLVKYCLGYQCITVTVWALKCTILVHFFHISLWQFIFFHVTLFHIVLFSYCAIFMLHFFVLQSFYVALFFVLHSLYVLHYFMLHFYTLQHFRFAFFSCFTFTFFFAFCNFSCCTISRGVDRTITNIWDGVLQQ